MKARRVKIEGAFYDPRRDGITQSLLGMFLRCRMLAKHWSDGLEPTRFGDALHYGNLAHEVLDRCLSAVRAGSAKLPIDAGFVAQTVLEVEQAWHDEHPDADPSDVEKMELHLAQIEATMPGYVEHYPKDFDGSRKWTEVEGEFKVESPVPGVFLRGKFDGAFEAGKNKALWLFETKTRMKVDEDLADSLPLDLQVQFYLYALKKRTGKKPRGVLYNVVRRPTINPHKGTDGESPEAFEKRIAAFKTEKTREKHREAGPNKGKPAETLPEYRKRLTDDVRHRPDFYFVRFEIAVTGDEMDAFERDLAGMITEFLRWWDGELGTWKNGAACRFPYACRFLPICGANDRTDFRTRAKVFPELER